MSSKCPGCGFYTLACQCRIDDNYCGKHEPDKEDGNKHGCGRIISDCHCDNHHDHWSYDNPNLDKFDNDDPCNEGAESD